MERLLERSLFASRWMMAPIYVGLALSLLILLWVFALELWHLIGILPVMTVNDAVLGVLALIDLSLAANLLLIVIFSGYENFVSRFDESNADVSFLGKLDAGSLKIKVASSIVAISSIHLLQIFLNAQHYDNTKLMWYTLIHLAFVVSAVMLGFLERLMSKEKDKGGKGGAML